MNHSMFVLCPIALCFSAIHGSPIPTEDPIQPEPWEVHVGVPPIQLSWNERPFAILKSSHGVRGRAYYRTESKQVVITWTHDQYADASLNQEIAVGYWPTCVAGMNDTRLVVAGKRKNADTVIELWQLQIPPIIVANPGGGSEPILSRANVTDIEELYSAKVAERDMVVHMTRNLFDASGVLVQFWSSRRLFNLDLSDPAHALTYQAVPDGSFGCIVESDLSKTYTDFYGANHVVRGYIYVFGNSLSNSVSPLILSDLDRNGVIDGSLRVTRDQWHELGLGQSSNYIP